MVGYEEQYHETVHNSLVNNPRYYEARAKVAKRKYFRTIPENARILEFSCGLGQDTLYFPNTVGFDISDFCLEFCRQKGKKVINDLAQAENHSFDLVFSAHTLEHVTNPFEILKTLREKLNEKGKLMLILPCESHGKASFEFDVNQHLFCWNFRTINNLLLTAGYSILENKYFRGAGYDKFLFTSSLGIPVYQCVTHTVAFFSGIKEICVIAKPK
jgi:SAM-dependent methyltransferase